MDAAAAKCSLMDQCRIAFCTCLGAPSANKCWIQATKLDCWAMQRCLSAFVICAESVAVTSTSSSCLAVRQTYTRDTTTDYNVSQIRASCLFLTCSVYAGFPASCDSIFSNSSCTIPPTGYRFEGVFQGNWSAMFTGSRTRYFTMVEGLKEDFRVALGTRPIRFPSLMMPAGTTNLHFHAGLPEQPYTSTVVKQNVDGLKGRSVLVVTLAYLQSLGGNSSDSTPVSNTGALAGSSGATSSSECDESCLIVVLAIVIGVLFVAAIIGVCLRSCLCREQAIKTRAQRNLEVPKEERLQAR